MTDTARRGALSLLLRLEAEGGYANLVADEGRLGAMEARERALLTALFYGTVERTLTLDYHVGTLAGRSAASLDPHTRALLRMGLYQILYMDIPPHAAVSETVALGRHTGERALVNGVLRAAIRRGELLPPPRERDLVRHLSIAHSIPAPTVRYFIGRLGEAEAEAIRLKALAEAEGIDKKAEAMKKYGEAAVVEMIMAALPEIARNVAEPLSKVDKITMYGEGNSAKLVGDIVNSTTQITEGISAGMGIDLKSLLMGALGGKLASDQAPQVVVVPQAQSNNDDQ